jgi:hypothetical protein
MSIGIRQSFKRVSAFAAISALVMAGGLTVGNFPRSPGKGVLASGFISGKSPVTANGAPIPAHHPATKVAENYGKLPLSFEPNLGQTDGKVEFLSHGRGYSLFLTGDEAVLTLAGHRASGNQRPATQNSKFEALSSAGPIQVITPPTRNVSSPSLAALIQSPKSQIQNSASSNAALTSREVVRLRLVGANTGASVVGEAELPGKTNYFIGKDPKKWRTGVATYAQVRFHNVYSGVDLVYHGSQGGQLEYDFVVAPGADPDSIRLAIGTDRQGGSDRLGVDPNGDFFVKIDGGNVRFRKPVVYQLAEAGVRDENRKIGKSQLTNDHRQYVEGHYVLTASNQVRFALGPYDHNRTLVIDPVLNYATYLGGSSANLGTGIAVGSGGHAYVVGSTFSTDFPTQNPYQSSNNSGSALRNAFVTELDPTGSTLIYSTYLGGSNDDEAYGIAVDSLGAAYVVGTTASSDFPTTGGAFQTSEPGFVNAFVTKLSPAGNALAYSTYLGGNYLDYGQAIAIDSSLDAYVTGNTQSGNFPTSGSAFQQSQPGSTNAFVTELNPTGAGLVYSTYLGGNYLDYGQGIAVDAHGNAYITGYTSSNNFPTTSNAFQQYEPGTTNAFVTKLNPSGSTQVYSTYLGSNEFDYGYGIAVNTAGNAFVTGATDSYNFPLAGNPVQSYYGGGVSDAFVAELTVGGDGLVYSTYLGGSAQDEGTAIALDQYGDAFVTGWTYSIYYFPINNAFQTTHGADNGEADAFVAMLNGVGSSLTYSSYLGGNNYDWGYGIAVDSAGNAYVTGQTSSTDFPVTGSAFQGTDATGTEDAFVAQIQAVALSPSLNLTPNPVVYGNQAEGTTSSSQSVFLSNSGTGPLNLTSITVSGNFSLTTTSTSCPYATGTVVSGGSCTIDITFTPASLGSLNGTLTVTDNATGSPQTVSLSGTGTPDVPEAGVSTPNLSFGNQSLNTTSTPQQVMLGNSGTAPLTIASITASTNFAESDACGGTVAIGGSCTLNVTFTPTTSGSISGTLTITDNSNGTAGSTQMVSLSGTGAVPVASLLTTTVPFGNQNEGTTSPAQSVTLSNTGNDTLIIASITTTANYAQTNNCLPSVASGNSCTINVTFTPSASGAQNGTLTVTDNSNGLAGSTQTASMTGTGTAPVAALSSPSLAFGNQSVGTTSASQSVTLNNTGNSALTITSITPSANYGATNNCGGSVAAGGSCTISVTFTPSASGAENGTLTVTDNSNEATGSTQTVSLTGTGTLPVAGVSPSSLSFGNQSVGSTSSSQAVTLNNTGNAPLSIASVTASAGFGASNDCGGSVAAGGSCMISVSFTPTATGAANGTLTITDNSNGVVGSTQTVSLSGTGAIPVASVSPSTLTFANQTVGTTSAAQVVTLNNTGNSPLTVSNIAITASFGQSSNCGGSVAAGASCMINVTFDPATTGSFNGTLTITDNSNGVAGSTQTVALSGTSTVPVASVSPASLTFASQGQGTTSASQAVTLSNTGNSPLTIANIAITINFGETNNCAGTIAGGGSCTINVTFAPTTTGALSGTLTISDNSNGVAGSTQTVSLSGTGTGVPIASLNPSTSLSVGAVAITTTSTSQPVTLSNTGSAPLTITSVAVSTSYAQTNNCGSSLAAGSSCTINVTFTPTAPGPLNGTLTVTDNNLAVAGSVQSLNLSGTGVDFALASPNGSQATTQGGQAAYTINVSSVSGAFSNPVTLACSSVPATITCVLATTTVTPGTNGATTQLTLGTTAGTTARGLPPPPGTPPIFPAVLLLSLLAVLTGTWSTRRQSLRRVAASTLLFAALLAMSFMAACGASGFPLPTVGGTPAGVYTITVTGTSGSTQHSTTITLTVTAS